MLLSPVSVSRSGSVADEVWCVVMGMPQFVCERVAR